MMYNILKTINSVKSANHHLDRLLSASAWSSLSFLIILQKALPADLTRNECVALLIFLKSTFTYTFPFQNLSSHYVEGTVLGCSILHLKGMY